MPREDARTRGRRLVAEGRLTVLHRGDEIHAICKGDSGSFHRCGYRAGRWACSCPARTTCAHLVALMLVTTVPNEWLPTGIRERVPA